MLPWVVLLACLALLGLVLWRAAVFLRRRGGSHVMAPIEEVWRPTAVAPQAEVRAQSQRRAPSPSPEDT
jgi:hypothetical protein